MTEQTENLILEILKKIQADAASFRAEVNARFEQIDQRFESMQDLIRKQRRDMAGLLVVGKSTAGTFAEDIAEVKKRLDAIESDEK